MSETHIRKVLSGVDVAPLLWALQERAHLWDQNTGRTESPQSPHHGLSDIWVRWSPPGVDGVNTPHESVWWPAADELPQARAIAEDMMRRLDGEDLGAVLITRIPPGVTCKPHRDAGWHARNYEKFAVQVTSAPGQAFHFDNEALVTRPGDVFWFENSAVHWVVNASPYERITLICCLRRRAAPQMLAGPDIDRMMAAHGIEVEHHFAPGQYAKRVLIPAGKRLLQHAHPFDHLSIIAEGRALVDVDGVETEHGAGECLTIAAGKTHSVTALDDLVWFCTHATDDTDPSTVDATILKE